MSTDAQQKNARVWPRLYVKRSREQRKFVNEMRAMGDVPWPARRFRVAPTFTGLATRHRCPVLVQVEWKRKGRLLGWVRKPLPQPVVCGAALVMVPFKGEVRCPECHQRAKLGRREARIMRPPMTGSLLALRVALQAASVAGRIFGRRSYT